MTDLPIIFSAPMIRALLEGRKTQTRRLLKIPTKGEYVRADMGGWEASTVGGKGVYLADGSPAPERPCVWNQTTGTTIVPRYQVGDRIWVKERWSAQFWDPEDIDGPPREFVDTPPRERTKDLLSNIYFAVDEDAKDPMVRFIPEGHWASPLYLPRWASRITLLITDVRVQRLQETTEEDAIAEGLRPELPGRPATVQYLGLWDGINGKRAPWSSNPWISALTFTVERANIDKGNA